MKTRPIFLLYFGLIGATISLISTSIREWGKATHTREGIIIFLSVVCVAVVHVIWYRYIRQKEVVNTYLNRYFKREFAGMFVLWIAITAGVFVSTLLMSFGD